LPLMEEQVRARLAPAVAGLLGVPSEQVALVRNTTEAIGTVLLGYPYQPGDEVIACDSDYWHMLNMLYNMIQSGKITGQKIALPLPASNPQAIVDAYAKAITKKTRLVLVTHASNRTGQIVPVAEIAKIAHAHGAEVVVDGAQTLGLFDYKLPELDCDYYACS